MSEHRYKSFQEFYPYYLSQHKHPRTKVIHVFGTVLGLVCLALMFVFSEPRFFILGLILSYGLLWISHFFIEKNRPATFQYPIYSIMGDFRMAFELLTGRLSLIKRS